MVKLNKLQINSLASGIPGKSLKKFYNESEKIIILKNQINESERKLNFYRTRMELLNEKLQKWKRF